MVGFRRPRMYNPKKEKKTSQAFWKRFFSSCRSISRACDHPFYYQSKLFEKEPILFEKKPQSFFFLPIPLSLLLIYLLLFCYTQEKKQIFLLYLSIYYWFYSFYYITILMHLKKMTTTLQKQKKVSNFQTKTKPHMQKFCPRKESKQIIILTSLNLLKKP